MNRLQERRLTAWLRTVGLCYTIFWLTALLWDGHSHGLAALAGAVAVAGAISFKECRRDRQEWAYSEEVEALRRQARQTKGDPAEAELRARFDVVIASVPLQERPTLRIETFSGDHREILKGKAEILEQLLAAQENDIMEMQTLTGHVLSAETVAHIMSGTRTKLTAVKTQLADVKDDAV